MSADLLPSIVTLVADELRRTRFPHPVPTVTAESDLRTDLRCCGVDYQCIAMHLDEQFGIEIPDHVLEEFSPTLWRTPADIAATVDHLLAQRRAA